MPPNASKQALCDPVHPVGVALGGTGQWGYKDDYIPHHEPFQYYASTANPHHLTVPADSAGRDTLAGSSGSATTPSLTSRHPAVRHAEPPVRHERLRPTGGGDRPRKRAAVGAPCRQLLEGPGFEDGHPGYSDPADEQAFVAREINELMPRPTGEARR